MDFLDPDQQVLVITLTDHGKKLLSEGSLQIKYYAFGDDEVDYSQLTDQVSAEGTEQ